jgi:hypothetical protein
MHLFIAAAEDTIHVDDMSPSSTNVSHLLNNANMICIEGNLSSGASTEFTDNKLISVLVGRTCSPSSSRGENQATTMPYSYLLETLSLSRYL